ncbi:MAG: sodium:solute symporter family transporter, partial [Planctomycetota bacterium]
GAKQIGLAGPFAGISGGALIVAGGANFPEGPPWEGGKKVWWDDVFVLPGTDDGPRAWLTDKAWKLPRPLAYGVSISTDEGIVCIGGCDAERCYADAFLLAWDPKARKITTKPLPALPRPLAFMAGASVGDTVYVCGGQEAMKGAGATKSFLALDMSKKGSKEGFAWKELTSWPGPARVLPIVAAQSDGFTDRLYVFSGRNVQPGAETVPLTDAYSYDPTRAEKNDQKNSGWKKLGPIAPKGESARAVMAGTGIDYGEYHILVFGGSDGKLFQKLAQLEKDIAGAKAAGARSASLGMALRALAARKEAESEKLRMLTDHPGFSRRTLAYHTLTDTWVDFGELPATSHVTTSAVRWGEAIVIPTGEISPGIRSPKVWKAETTKRKISFGWANWAVLVVYLASLVAMGVYFSRREKTTGDFFLAGKRVPWWAAGLSIYGTQLSAITFMAIPATTYRQNWLTYLAQWMIIAVAPVVAFLYIPFFCKLNVTTAYEFLEKRFNLAVRLYGSITFILYQLGRMAVVVLLPALALSAVTGVDTYTCIVIMGVLCTLYTVLGGIEAVIWTDVLQVGVLLGGALLSLRSSR